MKKFQFSENEYAKLSIVTGFPVVDLQKLDSMGLLVNEVAVKLVFEYEYKQQKKATKALPRLIIQAIANKYGLPVSKVRRFLFYREHPIFYCTKCQQEISRLEKKRNEGLCDKCMAESIIL